MMQLVVKIVVKKSLYLISFICAQMLARLLEASLSCSRTNTPQERKTLKNQHFQGVSKAILVI
jgi:hypothetical protein